MNIKEYFASLFTGIHSLIKGMEVTGKELVTPKVTEQYPENRSTLKIPDRFRATLQFIYDEQGSHKCIACKSCERNCPNGTIKIQTRMVDLPNGKKKMKLDKYIYDLGSCTFCNLCVSSCPTSAIEFSNDFEQAVFTREALVKQLNYLPEKDEPAPAPAPAKAEETKVAPKAEKSEETKVAPAKDEETKVAKPQATNQENKETK
ncbi:MAG: NADH-quinone oxidoreductase subunit I [Muribaculaceae bacterium]|nr:NADH-quinone oxidoreductase subunit I [Muribaculaceae bacterium]